MSKREQQQAERLVSPAPDMAKVHAALERLGGGGGGWGMGMRRRGRRMDLVPVDACRRSYVRRCCATDELGQLRW